MTEYEITEIGDGRCQLKCKKCGKVLVTVNTPEAAYWWAAQRHECGPLSTQRPSGLPASDGRDPGTFAGGDVGSSGKKCREGQNGQDRED